MVRVASGGLVYSQILGEADFTGGFRADTADAASGTIRAQQGVVFMKEATGGAKQAGSAQGVALGAPSMEGSVDRVVANGQVTVDRPRLHATGARLVYTTADQIAVLTGDAKDPPRATDDRGSTTTGAALELRHGCNGTGDTVEALGSVPGGTAGQAHTESRVDTARGKTAQ
jgi:lipopolysaccharide export system protein LptA